MRELLAKECKASHKALMSGWWASDSMAEAAELDVEVFRKPVDLGKILKWIEECSDGIEQPSPSAEHFRKVRAPDA